MTVQASVTRRKMRFSRRIGREAYLGQSITYGCFLIKDHKFTNSQIHKFYYDND